MELTLIRVFQPDIFDLPTHTSKYQTGTHPTGGAVMSNPFVPIDLTGSFNAGLENPDLGDRRLWPSSAGDPDDTPLQRLPAGDVQFWGIPFNLASASASKRFVLVCQEGAEVVPDSITIPVGTEARRLLFAHVCAPTGSESPTLEGAGEPIGEYRILFEDGSESVQLRRRFEVHDVEIPWGHHPFQCRNCQLFRSMPVDDRNLVWGRAQTGVLQRNSGRSGQRPGWMVALRLGESFP